MDKILRCGDGGDGASRKSSTLEIISPSCFRQVWPAPGITLHDVDAVVQRKCGEE
ncbi:MAG: hypothetical protein JW863_09820 [Chitinispirillaceae bacterium]|nr:hypothetical protein [Chitinispirillaceae bacterium]